jgi:small subunit ribosomal protein S4
MGRYTGPSCKLCRRSRSKLFLKGERCQTAKCALEKRNYPPGPQGGYPRKLSEYGIRLREKQKMRFFYGVSEAQIRNYFKKAVSSKGVTGDLLISIFERRLDSVVYRCGLAKSHKQARQIVRHGSVWVNGREVNIPSFISKSGDKITIQPKKVESFKARFDALNEQPIPTWLSYDQSEKTFTILHEPLRSEVDVPVQEQLIVEYYSR